MGKATDHPSVQRIARVAKALGPLLPKVVFIGGAIAPLLQTDPPFEEPRPTKDVDGVIATATYRDMEQLGEQLRELGFRQDLSDTGPIHRWRSPDEDLCDLVPSGEHLGGSGQIWDRLALETSGEVDLGIGRPIRHASAPSFLALKWAAFLDRGKEDPFASHDLEDFLALLAARPSVLDETTASPSEIRSFLAGAVSEILNREDLDDLLASHLGNAQEYPRVRARVVERMRALASISLA